MQLSYQRWKRWILSTAAAVAIAGAGIGAAHVRADRTAARKQWSPETKQAIESANHLSTAFRTVANELLPSVVAIENRPVIAKQTTGQSIRPSADGSGRNPFQGTPFEDLFRDFERQMPSMPGGPSAPRGQRRSPGGGIGSGVIIDEAGIILTNNHVVAGDGEITVRTHDGNKYVATDVWTDPKTDLAVVKIEASDLVAAELGDSDQMEIGDWVIALGQPFGLESTVTAGIVSAKHRGIGITDRENFLQTDAAINPGNSGGPLVNLRGEVVGINTAIHSRSGGNNGIGFAVPSNLARWVSSQLVSHGNVKRAYLGVGIQPVTADLAEAFDVKPRSGVAVTEVYPDTPAAKVGLKRGDVIVSFDGKPISNPQALQLAVERSVFGSSVKIEVLRDGKRLELDYEAAELPSEFGEKQSESRGKNQPGVENLGIDVGPLSDDVAKRLGFESATGVVITAVRDGSPAANAGLSTGMVIVEAERQPIESPADLNRVVKEHEASGDDGLLLLVRSRSGSRFVVVEK